MARRSSLLRALCVLSSFPPLLPSFITVEIWMHARSWNNKVTGNWWFSDLLRLWDFFLCFCLCFLVLAPHTRASISPLFNSCGFLCFFGFHWLTLARLLLAVAFFTSFGFFFDENRFIYIWWLRDWGAWDEEPEIFTLNLFWFDCRIKLSEHIQYRKVRTELSNNCVKFMCNERDLHRRWTHQTKAIPWLKKTAAPGCAINPIEQQQWICETCVMECGSRA